MTTTTSQPLSQWQILSLCRPLPDGAVKDHPSKKGMSAIGSIYVFERLNEVFGVGQWRIETNLLPTHSDGSLFLTVVRTTSTNKERTEFSTLVKTTLTVPAHGITYDCIAGSTNDDIGDAAKGGTTDGITKIASYMGIGGEVFRGQYSRGQAETAFAARIRPHLSSLIAQIGAQASIEELKALRTELPEWVVAAVTDAFKGRYQTLSGTTPATPAATAPATAAPVSEEQPTPTATPASQPDTAGAVPLDIGKIIANIDSLENINKMYEWLLRQRNQRSLTNAEVWLNSLSQKAETLGFTGRDEKTGMYAQPAQPA